MPLTAHERFVASVAFSPDGKTLASGSFDRDVILWNLTTTHPFGQPFTGSQNSLPEVLLESAASAKGQAFDPNGKILAIGDGKTITLQDAKTRQPLPQPLKGLNFPVASLIFSRDGNTLASISNGEHGNNPSEILLWDAKTHQSLGPRLEGHTGPVLTADFSPDGTLLATGGCGEYDIFKGCAGEVALWSVKERMLVGMPFTGIGRVISVAFSSDGKTLFSRADPPLSDPISKQPDIFQWDVSIESWRDRACRRANRNLTCKEWRQYLGSERYHRTCPDLPEPTEQCK